MAEDNVVDFAQQRSKRIHDVHDKRLDEMRKTFERVLPLPKAKKKPTKRPKKR